MVVNRNFITTTLLTAFDGIFAGCIFLLKQCLNKALKPQWASSLIIASCNDLLLKDKKYRRHILKYPTFFVTNLKNTYLAVWKLSALKIAPSLQ